ncbi:MAG TPA: hypothetical protein VLF91_03920 [Candidatus Saccharimonadales bacterium]|nr:hypothetical protein [Candidatus Saccharimonadales bacterium]
MHGGATGPGDQDFNVQVSPSPLVLTLTPGQAQTTTITVRNFSTHSETLRVKLSGFTLGHQQEINFTDDTPGNLAAWVSFDKPTIALGAGQSTTLSIHFATPTDVGFSYAFAVVLSRADAAAPLNTVGAQLHASIAVFCLANINRSDATSTLELGQLRTDKTHYTFLPVSFALSVKNTGNVISQPGGTIFIQRAFDSATPIAALPINPRHGYILPGQSRTFSTSWASGFPVYVSTTANGKTSVHLNWNLKHIGEFRFGKYVAKAVVVYSNGQQDIPLIASTSFWVIPWWLLISGILLLIVLLTGVVGWGWLLFKGTKKVKRYAARRSKV